MTVEFIQDVVNYYDNTIKEIENFFSLSDSVLGMFLILTEDELNNFINFVDKIYNPDSSINQPYFSERDIKELKILFCILTNKINFNTGDLLDTLESPNYYKAVKQVLSNAITAKSAKLGLVDLSFKENEEVEITVKKEKLLKYLENS